MQCDAALVPYQNVFKTALAHAKKNISSVFMSLDRQIDVFIQTSVKIQQRKSNCSQKINVILNNFVENSDRETLRVQ